MKIRFFVIPVLDSTTAEKELNAFLSRHKILTIDRHLVNRSDSAYWALSVTYHEKGIGVPNQPPKGKIDYREVLPPEEFEVFVKLRRLRKEMAEQEGVPAYNLFTNEQLATMIRQRVDSIDALKTLSGVGPTRIKKYGAAFLKILQTWSTERANKEPSDA